MPDAPIQSSLAPAKPKRKSPVALLVLLAVVVIGAVAVNLYIARHRTLHLLSGFSTPVSVAIDGGTPTTLSGPFPTTVPISEGTHHVVVTGGLTNEFDITVSSAFFARFFDAPVFVLNPGGTSLLTYETVVYSKDPLPNGGGSVTFHYGQPYLQFPNVDYAFLPFPKTINSDSQSTVARSRLGLVEESVSKVMLRLLSNQNDAEALRLAEWDLKLHPEDTRTLDLYAAIASGGASAEQARTFIKEHCNRRPIELEWHRVYQQMLATEADRDELAAEYEALLKSEPDNGGLLYLRGLLFRDGAHARSLFEQALQKAPRLAWPHVALAQYFIARGEWKTARQHLDAARLLAPNNEDITDQLDDTRFALGEYSALEADLRPQLLANPGDVRLSIHLCDALVAQHKADEAKALAESFEALLGTQGGDSLGMGRNFHEYTLYALGGFAELEKSAPKTSKLYFQTLFELGKLKELCELQPLKTQAEPFWALAVSAAWAAQKDDANAKAWRDKAAELFGSSGTPVGTRIAALLRGAEGPALEAVADVNLTPKQEATLLAVLAQQFPAKAGDYRALARSLNADYAFPYYFLNRMLK